MIPFSERQLRAFQHVYPDAHIRNGNLLVWTTNKGKRLRCLEICTVTETTWEKKVRIRKSEGLSITITNKRNVLN